eukprot:14015578-Alexandrium_andersonii.AAC.1
MRSLAPKSPLRGACLSETLESCSVVHVPEAEPRSLATSMGSTSTASSAHITRRDPARRAQH